MASPDRNQLSAQDFKAVWTGTLVPPTSGVYTVRLKGTQKAFLELDDKLVSNKHITQRERENNVTLEAGREYKIKLSFDKSRGDSSIQLAWIPPGAEDRLNATLARSVEAARQADLAIVVIGLDQNTETEGMDRLSLRLPEYHDQLVERVRAANSNTVVVVYGGTPMAMDPWFDQVPAVVLPWYAGIENGHALATLLAGDRDFGGRLPVTFPKKYEDSPAWPGRQQPDRQITVEHNEGVFVGYRWFDAQNIAPLIPFGHGLSYSTYEYGDPVVTQTNQTVHLAIPVKNTGKRDGIEVVQVYVHELKPLIPRPPRELKGFKSISLAAGETKTVEFDLDASAFSYWNPATRKWTLDPGAYEIQIGRSSRNILRKSGVSF